MKVICSHVDMFCHECPHREPHEPHGPRQTDFDGDKPCTSAEFCDGGANKYVKCVKEG